MGTLEELAKKEAELWKFIKDAEETLKPIRHEWSCLRVKIEKAKIREEVMREMSETK